MRRTRAPLLIAVAATAVLAGCGSPGGYGSSGSSTGSGSPGAGSPSQGAATISTHAGPAGTYLTAAHGRAVYLFEADTGGTSTCTGACAAAWPPVLTTGTAHASGSATPGDLGTVQRPGGGTQVTYQGHPLYYFAPDTQAGQTSGQGSTAFGAAWWLVSPDGTALHGGSTNGSSSGSGGGSTRGSQGGYGY